MNKEEKNPPLSVDNIYSRLNGRVPLQKAIPFGLQHVLAMFAAGMPLGTCMQQEFIQEVGVFSIPKLGHKPVFDLGVLYDRHC